MSSPPPKVSVAIMAYNHEKFIAQAIDSVLAQQTDFPVEIVIGEDESTDRTRTICQEYAGRHPDRIRLILRSRSDPERQMYSMPVVFNICETLKACCGEYIAYLDGDDYWTDDRKLAIQAETLDRNPDYVFCAHRYQRLYEPKQEVVEDRFADVYGNQDHMIVSYDNFMDPPLLLSSFMMLRRSALAGYFEKECGWDNLLWAHLLSKGGKAFVQNRTMGVYRKHPGGVWSSLSQRQVHKSSHSLQTLLVKNEGFRSQCIANSYNSGAIDRSRDLVEEAVESLNVWQAHANEVTTTMARHAGRHPPGAVRGVSDLFSAIQERLLRAQHEYLGIFCLPAQKGGKRLARLCLLALVVIAASPLMLLVAVTRRVRRPDEVPAQPRQS